jgi:TDG/mug DNA glycosylase family protein
MHVRSFPPIATPRATRLVLGTMPGKMSLAAHEYYAHPRNAFWDIMQALLGVSRALPYGERVKALQKAGIAVWDVLAACTRTTSLDSDIDPDSIVPNDFVPFLSTHPRIRTIYFNGNNARRLFERHVLPQLTPRQQQIARVTLPATSPAHARMNHARKVHGWRVITEP